VFWLGKAPERLGLALRSKRAYRRPPRFGLAKSGAGEHRAGVAAYNHSFKRHPVAAVPAANQQQNAPVGCTLHRLRAKMSAVNVAEPSPPLFRLFYQVEIRCLQFPHRKSLTCSQRLISVTVQQDCGNCGVVT
jgi:hypothetical protein